MMACIHVIEVVVVGADVAAQGLAEPESTLGAMSAE